MMTQKLLLGFILVMALFLRLMAIEWGVPGVRGIIHYPLHPDEEYMMIALGQMNPESGDLNPDFAHIEGTLSYYFWYLAIVAAHEVGVLDSLPHTVQVPSAQYGLMILICRLVCVLFSVGVIFLVYLVVIECAGRWPAAMIAALCLAVAPFDVLHSGFMRAHGIGNFFLCLSLLLYQRMRRSNYRLASVIWAGVSTGLTVSARYNLALICIIPGLVIMSDCWRATADWRAFTLRLVRLGSILSVSALVGLGLGDPYLVMAFKEVRASIAYQGTFVNQDELGWPGLISLARPLIYLKRVIPFGLDWLTVPFYLGALASPFLDRKNRILSFAVLIFAMVYLFLMSKGYPIFAVRTALPLFPLFAILTALSWSRLVLVERRRWAFVLSAFLAVCVVHSAAFAYGTQRALGDWKSDPFLRLLPAITKDARANRMRSVEICVLSYNWDWYQIRAVNTLITRNSPLRAEVVACKVQDLESDRIWDYVVLYHFEARDPFFSDLAARLVEKGRYRLLKELVKPLVLSTERFDYEDAPHDFRYPFPRIYVLKRALKPAT